MTLQEVLATLTQHNIKLGLEGDQLKIRAAKGAITPDIKQLLIEHKPALLEWIRQKQASAAQSTPIPRRASDSDSILSYAQQRLWFIDQLEPGNPAYNIPAAFKICGALDLAVLQRVIDEIVRRHEILRTTYLNQSGNASQQIASSVQVPITVEKLTGTPDDTALIAMARSEAAKPFDLAEGPLLRIHIVELPPQQGKPCYLLLLTLHHIITDGWSNGVLMEEVATLYQAFSQGKASPLPELDTQYADYAAWQRSVLTEAVLEQKLAYWKTQLADAAVLELLTDHPRPAQRSGRGRQISFTVNADITAALNELARQQGVTLFVVLMAAFKALLHRYTGQQDICIGTPIAGRTRAELNQLIGFFVNTLALRSSVAGDISFAELIQREHAVMLDAQSHQDVPFETIVDSLGFSRDMSITPVFQTMLALQNTPASRNSTDDALQIEAIETDSQSAKFDLLVNFAESSDTPKQLRSVLKGVLEYDTDLFEAASMERLISHLQQLLADVSAHPRKNIAAIELMSEAERQQVLYGWNQTETVYPRDINIATLFERQAREQGERIALDFEHQQMRYAELDRHASQLAHYLQQHGVSHNDKIAICLDRSIDMIISMLAVIKVGAAYVPLDPDYPDDRLSFIIGDTASKLIITHVENSTKLQALDSAALPELLILESSRQDIDAQNNCWQTDPDNQNGEQLAYIIYTSGSTGTPKGVLAPQRGIARLVLNTHYIDIGPDDALSHFSNVSFDAATYEIWGPLLNGGRVVGISKETLLSPDKFGAILREKQVNAVFITVALFNLYISEYPAIFSGLKYLYVGGEAQDPNKIRKALAADNPPRYFSNIYGPTENTTYSSWYIIEQLPERTARIPIGKPISNSTMYVLDEHQQPVPIGLPGEIYNGGDGVALGYLNRDDLTREKFMPDPFINTSFTRKAGAMMYRSGDIGRWLADGNIDIIGRVDDQVKVRGFRIELGEIDNAIGLVDGVDKRIVIVREDEPGEKVIAAYVVPSADNKQSDSDFAHHIRSTLQTHLPAYMQPGAIVILDEMPVTSNGKTDKKALPKPDPSQLLGTEYVAPSNPQEEQLAAIWTEILGVEKIGIHDNFFELGGHSLLATRVVARIRESLGRELNLKAIFETPTISGIAYCLENTEQQALPPLEKTDCTQPLAVSFAQQRLWIIDQIQPESPMYNVPLALRITGDLNVAALKKAFAEIVRRHETLRTHFAAYGDEAQQIVTSPEQWTLPEFDVPDDPSLIQQRVYAFLLAPFKLTAGPLFRVQLLKLSGQTPSYVLLVCMHHIISDGWSVDLLVRELTTLYSAFAEGRESPLPELKRQYSDYAAWQRQWLQGDELDKQTQYWREQLRGVRALELPTDHPRPPMLSVEGRSVPLRFSPELSNKLRQFSQQHGCTVYMTLLAAFQIVLSRYSGEDDIAVGSPIAGRTLTELEPMIGCFINTLVLRNQINESQSFADFLQTVRTTTLDAYRHQDIPFEKLVDALQVPRNLSNTPLFQVLFVLHNSGGFSTGSIDLAGLQLTPFADNTADDAAPVAAKFDISLGLVDDKDGIYGDLEYRAALFERARMERLGSHLVTLLENLLATPQLPLVQVSMLPDNESHKLLTQWNQTLVDYPREKLLHELIEERVQICPDAPALSFQETTLSYRELNEAANRLARHLQGHCRETDRLIGVCLERSTDMVVALLAVLKSACAYVPIDPEYPQDRTEYVIDSARLDILITQQSLLDRLPSDNITLLCVDTDAANIAAHESTNLSVRPQAARPMAYTIYTSGSTGKPKGVAIPQQAFVNFLCSMTRDLGMSQQDVLLAVTTLSFDIAGLELFVPLLLGGKVVIASRMDAMDDEALTTLITGQGITVLQATPATWHILVNSDWQAPRPLKGLCGGEPLPPRLANELIERGVDVYNMYGPTETTVWSTFYRLPGKLEESNVSIGKPIANTSIFILDQHRKPVPIGVSGQLWIGGDGVSFGYLGRDDLTAAAFIDNPFKNEDPTHSERIYCTGDLARYLSDGRLECLGRADNQVKVRGYRIELGEIETVLLTHPAVKEAIVNTRDYGGGNVVIIGYVVPYAGEQADSLELRRFLGKHLPAYMVPNAFVTLEEIPLTANGKADRKALPDLDVQQQITTEYVAPDTDTEKTLCLIWSDVLNVEKVGTHDNFFDLGGHSLQAIKMNNQLREQLAIELPLSRIFETANIEELAATIDTILWARQAPQVGTDADDSEDREEFEL